MQDFIWTVVWQGILLFILSTGTFDFVHYLLHRWRYSRIGLLRVFSSWHQVHHDFLDKNMDVHEELKWRNLWAHLVPEYLTSIAGTVIWLVVFDPSAVAVVCAVHTVLFAVRIKEEGLDTHHMAMDRVSARIGTWFVSPSYHAMHHVNPLAYYSSFLGLFDMLFGTALELRGKRVTVTGATGALGSELTTRLERLGAKVTGVGRALDVDFEQTDILVLAHGSRGSDAWEANVASFIRLGDGIIEVGKNRLVPPEVWAIGSESEILGFDEYAVTKRRFADYAALNWRRSREVIYRHIVPAAFASRMGWGPMTAGLAASWTLFLVRRGFKYVPVTWSGLAYLNWFRFVWAPRRASAVAPAQG